MMVDIKIAYQRGMIRQGNLGNLEAGDGYLRTVENIVQLAARGPAGMGGPTIDVGIREPCGSPKQVQLTVTPQRIEISGNNDGFLHLLQHAIQVLQLILTVPELEGKMHEENGAALQFQFNNEALYTVSEIVETFRYDLLIGQYGVSLFVQHGHFLDHG